jgi:ubiquitin
MGWQLGISARQTNPQPEPFNEPAKLAVECSPGQAQRNEVERSAALGKVPEDLSSPL